MQLKKRRQALPRGSRWKGAGQGNLKLPHPQVLQTALCYSKVITPPIGCSLAYGVLKETADIPCVWDPSMLPSCVCQSAIVWLCISLSGDISCNMALAILQAETSLLAGAKIVIVCTGLCWRAFRVYPVLTVLRAAGTHIKQESSAAAPDDGVPMQAVKQGTSLLDALNGVDGGNSCLPVCILTHAGLAIGSTSSIETMHGICKYTLAT